MTRTTPSTALRRPRRRRAAFTVTELMVALAVLAILSGLVIHLSLRDWRREQVNAAVIELAGWLETVRRSALKGSSCKVTITAGTYSGRDSESPVALSPSPCGTVQPFRLSGITAGQAIKVVETRSFTFTPAGTLSPPPDPGAPLEIRLQLADGSVPQRCLQLDGLLGAIDVGHSDNGGPCVIGQGI